MYNLILTDCCPFSVKESEMRQSVDSQDSQVVDQDERGRSSTPSVRPRADSFVDQQRYCVIVISIPDWGKKSICFRIFHFLGNLYSVVRKWFLFFHLL